MSEIPSEKIFDYLCIWRTRAQIQTEFGLSYAEVYHFIRWGIKGNYIKRKEITSERKDYAKSQRAGMVVIYKKT